MRRQNNSSPQCYCHCDDHQTESPPINRNNIYRGSPSPKRNEYAVLRNGRRESDESAYDDEPIGQRTRQTFASMRQKACRFITSDTECSTGSDQGEYESAYKQGTNHGKGRSLLKQAQDSINYPPQSEFLRKFKNDFHCQCDVKEDQNSNQYIPRICQQCIAKSNEIIKLLELLNAHGLAAANQQNEQCRPCQCSTEQGYEQDQEDDDEEDEEEDDEPSQNTNGINQIVKTCRSVVDELKNVLTTMGPYMNGECYNENLKGLNSSMNRMKQYDKAYASHGGGECKPTRKSQHVSRSKKRVKCRGKRKRKSKESNERCSSQGQFEPSLKQPHENSCERCWRFASPSRSPVNKPNQRYDPNFRRAHSCQDFLSADGGQSESNRSGTPEKMTPVVSKRVNELGKCQGKEGERGPTKVKELASDTRNQRSPRSRIRTDSPSDGSRKPRPKSCTPGTSTRGRGSSTPYSNNNKGPQFVENRPKSPRSPCPARDNNKVKSPNASNQQKRNDSGKNLISGLKRSKEDSNLRIADFNAQRQKKQKPQNGSECRECTCNKGQGIKGEPSRRPQARPVTKSSPLGQLPSPVRTQSSVLLESRGRNSPEVRPQTADYNAQTFCLGLQSPMTIGMNQREVRTTGESKYCACHGPSPRVPKPSTIQECSPSSTKPRRYNCQQKNNGEEQMNLFYNRNLPLRNTSKQSSETNANFYQSSDNCNVQDNSFNFRQDYGMNSMSNNTGRRVPCSFTPTSTENGEIFNSSTYRENQRYCEKMNQTYPPGYRRNYSSRDQNQNLSFNVPKKYCVFYMTKSKNDKDNEVEVLVEELTERCKASNKDSKMAAVREKMKKLDDCPLESMALRFQKGINGSSKNFRTESGRILYF